jgi:hypothetical protein
LSYVDPGPWPGGFWTLEGYALELLRDYHGAAWPGLQCAPQPYELADIIADERALIEAGLPEGYP